MWFLVIATIIVWSFSLVMLVLLGAVEWVKRIAQVLHERPAPVHAGHHFWARLGHRGA